ncbi:MAG: sulfotransferase family 2 domain-containing protein [Halioglobus sp.]|nr:sulfotransferase family 2 domain-containing protein [Halioglobus sp.]
MLVSVHMPKTAGLSFRRVLEQAFGAGFRHDYADYPLAATVDERRRRAMRHALLAAPGQYAGVDCLHGHFLPLKYLLLADDMPCRFVTWLREPVARLVSHYHYWQRAYDPASGQTSALHRRVVEEAWTLEQFCLSHQLRNLYTEFLWGLPLQRLDFVGITEHFDEDLRYFSAVFLGTSTQPPQLNRRPEAPGGALQPALSRLTLRRIRSFHARDMALYAAALALRAQRAPR